MVTCHPYAVNTHRFLVRGVRTEYDPEEETQQELAYVDVSSGTFVKRVVDARAWIAVALIVMVIVETIIFVLILTARHKYRRRKFRMQQQEEQELE